MRGLTRIAFFGLAVATAAICPAYARATEYAFVQSIGTMGSGPGEFNYPFGITFDPSGNLWIADDQNNRVQEFTGAGALLRTFGTLGTDNGEFDISAGIA